MSHTSILPSEDDPGDESLGWDPESPPRLRVMWGRFVLLGLLLVAAFALGRLTAPDPAAGDLAATRESLREARSTIDDLEARLAQESSPAPSPSPEPEPTTTTPTGEEEPAGRTYVVKPGDTLRTIALRFYEDASLDDVIAEANDIADPSLLNVGLELIIPDRPEL